MTDSLRYLDLKVLGAQPLKRWPFDHLVVPNFVSARYAMELTQGFPYIERPGSFPLHTLDCGYAFSRLVAEMRSPDFRSAIEAKFDIDLGSAATMFTARGRCQLQDGQIHTDSKSKIITVLLYLNDLDWSPEGGRLRLLTEGADIEAFTDEVAPNFGSLVVFRRSDNSWHGHLPFEGPRRIVQMNWVTSGRVAAWEQLRHTVSAWVKHRAA
jgi:hypothetical protein